MHPGLPWPARAALTVALLARDSISAPAERLLPPKSGLPPGALEAAVRWLAPRTWRPTEGVRRRASPCVRGWLPAYPETTGYVLGTLLAYGERSGESRWIQDAVEMGDWEIEVQRPDGGSSRDPWAAPIARSSSTPGWFCMGGSTCRTRARGALPRGRTASGRLPGDHQRDDGTWDPDVEYARIPHAYNARVAWALLRLRTCERRRNAPRRRPVASSTGSCRAPAPTMAGSRDAFSSPEVRPAPTASPTRCGGCSRAIAITGENAYLDAAVARTPRALMRKLEVHAGHLLANYDASWAAASRARVPDRHRAARRRLAAALPGNRRCALAQRRPEGGRTGCAPTRNGAASARRYSGAARRARSRSWDATRRFSIRTGRQSSWRTR